VRSWSLGPRLTRPSRGLISGETAPECSRDAGGRLRPGGERHSRDAGRWRSSRRRNRCGRWPSSAARRRRSATTRRTCCGRGIIDDKTRPSGTSPSGRRPAAEPICIAPRATWPRAWRAARRAATSCWSATSSSSLATGRPSSRSSRIAKRMRWSPLRPGFDQRLSGLQAPARLQKPQLKRAAVVRRRTPSSTARPPAL